MCKVELSAVTNFYLGNQRKSAYAEVQSDLGLGFGRHMYLFRLLQRIYIYTFSYLLTALKLV